MASIYFKPDAVDRRKFIQEGIKTVGAAALLSLPSLQAMAQGKEYSVQEIIDLIVKEIPGAPFKDSVDTIKTGSGSARVTGIVTTMFATVEVIRKTIALNANFIIAHEPTFYNHTDDTHWAGPNKIVQQKIDLLNQHHINVWRFHDYWHSVRPDGISYGVLKKTGWLQYNKDASTLFTIPATSLGQMAAHLKRSLGIRQIRMIGDPSSTCSKIALLPGAAGGQSQIGTMETGMPDLLIVGEVNEWETPEYFRDARAMGSKTSLLVLGHIESEEPGMEWLVNWLQPKLEGIKVTHLPSTSPFTLS